MAENRFEYAIAVLRLASDKRRKDECDEAISILSTPPDSETERLIHGAIEA